ncbi:hypothetical protein ACJX0J_004487 [Zea mays]
MDYLATMFTEAITVNAPEFLENIQIPKRASYIRVIIERELIYDLFEAATGMRMMHNYFRIGGVAADLPYGWMDKCLDFCDYFLQGVVEYQELITQNPHFFRTTVNWGLSGPMLRASGIQWDLRKIDPYESYNQFDWKVQWQKEGDSLARYLVRVGEMRESIKIIQQAVEKIPGGPYENLEARRFKKAKNPNGMILNIDFWQELYVRMIVFSLRWKIRPPGFINLQILPELVKKMKLADIMTILGKVEKEEYPHRYNNVLFLVYPFRDRFVLADLSIGVFLMDCDFNKKSHFLRTRKKQSSKVSEGLGTLKVCPIHFDLSNINSSTSNMPIGFLVIKPNILVLNMVYFILFLT